MHNYIASVKKSLLSTLTVIILLLYPFLASATLNHNVVEIIKIEAKVTDFFKGIDKHQDLNKLCITEIKTKLGSVLIVEDIYMCYWGQKLESRIGEVVTIVEDSIYQVRDSYLESILLSIYPDYKIFIFEYE